MLDVKIVNARVVDGTGAPWFRGSIGIKNGRIVGIGLADGIEANQEIDAGGRVVCPGFVDVHTHDDLAVLRDPIHAPKLLQGVTSAVLGNCGFGGAPASARTRADLVSYIAPVLGPVPARREWWRFCDYVEDLKRNQASLNVVTQVAHGAVRIAVMGFDARPATPGEISDMSALVEEAMQAGAIGLSLGLLYAPGCYAERGELIALARVAARCGGMLNCHIRAEGDSLLDSLDEVFAIAEAAEAPIHISHLKVIGKRNWGTIQRALDQIEVRRQAGLDITCDIYTYTAGSSTLMSVLPPWVSAGGIDQALARLADPAERDRIRRDMQHNLPGWDNFVAMLGWDRVVVSGVDTEANRNLEGLNFAEIASLRGNDPCESMMDLILEERGRVTMILHQMSEEDVKAVLRSDFAMIGSDGIPIDSGRPHPRHYGTFPRMIAKYVREERLMSLEHAVRKMTSISARRFGLRGRGIIAEGMHADLVIFDDREIRDTATFDSPRQFPEGISHVLVNGRVAATGSTPSEVRSGTLVQHGASCPCCNTSEALGS
jgi:N-acyl-D-amino-acid deacylase